MPNSLICVNTTFLHVDYKGPGLHFFYTAKKLSTKWHFISIAVKEETNTHKHCYPRNIKTLFVKYVQDNLDLIHPVFSVTTESFFMTRQKQISCI